MLDSYKNRAVVTVVYSINGKEISTETMDAQSCLGAAESKIRETINLFVEENSNNFCIDVSYKDAEKGLLAEVSFTADKINYKIQFFVDGARHVTPKLILSDIQTLRDRNKEFLNSELKKEED